MGRVRLFLGALLLAALAGAIGAPARADVTITLDAEVTSPQGTETTTVTQYYTPTKMRNEQGEASVSIIDLDNGRIITLMPAMKIFIQHTIEEMKKQAAQVAQMPELKVSVEETDETEEINGYSCRKVIVRVTKAGDEAPVHVTEHWMTADAKGVEAVHEFQKKMAEVFKDVPRAKAGLEARKQLAEKGLFPIKTVEHIKRPDGEMVMTMTVTKIEEGDLDEKLFEVPEGYTEQTFKANVPAAPGKSKAE